MGMFVCLFVNTGATHYYAQLCLSEKELNVCNSWDLDTFDLLNGLALSIHILLRLNNKYFIIQEMYMDLFLTYFHVCFHLT